MIEPLLREIEPLVVDELYRANLVNPQFHSPHEGWAIIREEVQEAENEMKEIRFREINLERYVFTDSLTGANEEVMEMRKAAVRLAAEAIQVAAMCDKWKPYGETK